MEGTTAEGKEKTSVNIIVAVVVIIAVVVISLMMFGRRGKFEPVIAGKNAPGFKLPDLDGKITALSDFKGKVVFLNFWATWCKPCEEEMPSMQMLYDDLKDENFEMLAVSLDSKGPGGIREFARKYGLTFPILHDRKGKVKEIYKTTGVPETFIIDQNGIIAEKVWGPRDWSRADSVRVIYGLLREGPRASY
ncbi:MAG: TlpA disulfide reductase family protein [Thermodesulfobacteriota bacterium]